jgi:uncharacterized Fe-S cluster protein YjdI
MASREYVGVGITVHWDSARCFHSERCTTGLPAVFDRSRRPWVDIVCASGDDIAAVIDTCPSGALTYTRTDGAANGRRGRTFDENPDASRAVDSGWQAVAEPHSATTPVTIWPLVDGPYAVVGLVALTRADGSTVVDERCELCRCGHSSSKPYCDGSHVRVGFRAAGVVLG